MTPPSGVVATPVTAPGYTAWVSSSMLFVSDLARSVRFYAELLGCETAVLDEGAALMLAPGGFQIYLVDAGDRSTRVDHSLGSHGLLWAVDTLDELTAFETALRAAGSYLDTHAEGGISFVEGRDPDGLRVMVAHPSPAERPRSMVAARLFS